MTRAIRLLTVFIALHIFCGGCKTETVPSADGPEATLEDAVRTKIKELTREAYTKKKVGDNQAALNEFKKLARMIKDELHADPYETASNLDDQASVLLRTGQSKTALKQYNEAREILARLESERAKELLVGVDFRLRILKALGEKGVTCHEPPKYNNPDLPYFADKTEAYKAIAKVNATVRDCFEGPAKPVTVSVIITGDGRIVMTNPRGPKSDRSLGLCVADRLLKLGKIVPFPQFGACFRPYSYPFAVGG